jgi:hypothetical protein
VLKSYELCDGIGPICKKIGFRLPLRGLCSPYLSPSRTNVSNRFSVRYFAQIKLLLSKCAEKPSECEYGMEETEHDKAENSEDCEDPWIIGGQQELVLWR